MSVTKERCAWGAAGMLWALMSGSPALADDTELFVVDSSQFPETRPNVLLVMDTSGSMADEISTQPAYDPAATYTGPCVSDHVYWQEDNGGNDPPDCDSDWNDNDWFEHSALKCGAALEAFPISGYYIDRMVMFDQYFDEEWEELRDDVHDRPVECRDDAGEHGDGVDTTRLYAHDPDWSNSGGWTSDSNDDISWKGRNTYTIYDGNWLNWYYGDDAAVAKKIDIVKDVAADLLSTVNGINVSLMRYNRNVNDYGDDGGPVIYAMEDIATARSSIIAAINGLPADGNTPLSETMYEAARYYRGMDVLFGNIDDNTPDSVDAARTAPGSATYKTPVEFACQKNFIVYLSDGEPTRDSDADNGIESMIGKDCSGNCLDELAEYLFVSDQFSGDGEFKGLQNVITHTIGFALDIQVLEDAAAKGGGKYFQANNTAELSTALTKIVSDILETQTTFTSPAITVNSFNRTQNLDDLYITMFQPSQNLHWPGNLKKYELRDAVIVDANGNPAVAGDYFSNDAQSFWSAGVDGASVTKGGAANMLPSPTDRNVYTCLDCVSGREALTAAGNEVVEGNIDLTDAVLGIGGTGDPARAALIDFIRGADVTNVDGQVDTTVRYQIGDPLHSQPATVMYGQDDSIIYFATNDGYVHAIDADDGIERWAFIPEEFLPDLADLYANEPSSGKHYAIDGSLRVQIAADNNGTIDGSDKVYLFFGLRRGGDSYYALDVTDPDAPQFLWKKSSSDMPTGLGQSWSNPVPTRIDVSGGTYSGTNGSNDEKLVLVFGAGYDLGHDQPDLPTPPDTGNGIVILDSVNGNVLWHVTKGGGDMSTKTTMPNMNYSFAGDIKVVDLDGDRLADRMYAADMGGQVWRFDVFNGKSKTDLVTGGVIAQLGDAPGATAGYDDNRRFYYAPDVAVVNTDEHNFMHIGIGSGHRASPNSTVNHDRFYALRDHNPFKSLTQDEFDAREADPITETDLPDVLDELDGDVLATLLPPGADGWRLELRVPGSTTWVGEKVLAESRTFDNKVFFTTFTPGASATANDCTPRLGTNRLYVVDLFTGAPPPTNLDGEVNDDATAEPEDRYRNVGGSIVNTPVFLFPSADDQVVCVGIECFDLGTNDPVRTFWTQESVDQ